MVGVGANRGSVIAVQLYVRIRLGRHSDQLLFGFIHFGAMVTGRPERASLLFWLSQHEYSMLFQAGEDLARHSLYASRIDRCQVRLQAKHRLRTIYQGLCELQGLSADGLF